jgi:transcriptional regulator with XRE-family HTH domain
MPSVSDVLERIKVLKNIKKDADLAKMLGVEPNTVTTWRKRGSLPYEKIIAFCEREKVSLDALFMGEGRIEAMSAQVETPGKGAVYDRDLLREVVEVVEEIFERESLHLPPPKMAELITLLYEELLEDRDADIRGRATRLIRLAS